MDHSEKIKKLIDRDHYGLFKEIREIVEKSEISFQKETKDSHLWEHTLNVASIALRLAEKEKADPLTIALTAIFHDSGKFQEGKYHSDDIPEEEESIRIAASLFKDFDVPSGLGETVTAALSNLYNSGGGKNRITDIIHDADFLSKSGPLGIGEFFIKGVLRGENLINRIINSATKELTYSENMASNMRTGSGGVMARKDKAFSRKFFRVLFEDLKKKGIADLVIGNRNIETEKCKKKIKLVTVSERECGSCGGKPEFNTSFDKGIKCEKLTLTLFCQECKKEIRETSFCLPEICREH